MSATNVPPQGTGAGLGDDLMGMLPPEMLAQLSGQSQEQTGVDPSAIGGFYNTNFFGPQAPTNNPYFDAIDRPFYKNGDEWRILQNLPPEETRRLQDRLAFVGLLEDYRPGDLSDPNLIGAVKDLMTVANRQGSTWKDALGQFETNIQNGAMEPFGTEDVEDQVPQVPSAEAVPDYTSLKRRVIRHFRDTLRRDPTQAEVRMFADEMMADFEAQAAGEFRRRAETRDLPDDVGAAHVPVQEQIDPVARFEQAFEQRMGGQIETLEEQANTATGAQAARQSIASAARESGTS